MVREGVTCLREELLDAQLEAGTLSTLEHESLVLHVEGSEDDPRSAVIRLLRGDEPIAERSFSPGPERCSDFHAAIAVTIGIMLRSVEVEVEVQVQDQAQDPVPEHAQQAPPAPVPSKIVRPFTFAARASGVLGWQVEASRTRGLVGELELGGVHWAMRAGVLAAFSRTARFDDVMAGYATRVRSATLDACWRMVSTTRVLADLCAGVLIGALQARGVAGPDSQRLRASSHAWAALRGELDVGLRVFGHVWVIASVSPMHGLRTLTLTADQSARARAAESLPPNGVLLGLGLAYELHRQGFAREGHR